MRKLKLQTLLDSCMCMPSKGFARLFMTIASEISKHISDGVMRYGHGEEKLSVCWTAGS